MVRHDTGPRLLEVIDEVVDLDLDELFRQFAPYVATIGYRLLGRDGELDDLVQDVFIVAHRGLRNLRNRNAVKGWLATVAVRDQGKILEVKPARDGDQCSYDQVVTMIDPRAFNAYDVEGLAYGEGKLFISVGGDLGGAGIYVLSPGGNGVFDGIPPTGDDEVTKFDTLSLGLRDPEGIGFHPERGTLFIVSRIEYMLVETTPSGTALNTYDISFTEIRKPSGVGIGPGSQDPEKYSIYITDRGVHNNDDPNENDGKIYEFLLMEQVYPSDIQISDTGLD